MLIWRRGEPHLTHLGTSFMAKVFQLNSEAAALMRVIPKVTSLRKPIVKPYREKHQNKPLSNISFYQSAVDNKMRKMDHISDAQKQNIRVYREYYSKFAEDYEERTKAEAKKVAETMIRWIDLCNLRILDFGVGTGSVWEQLYLRGVRDIQVVGLDIALGMLKIAKRKGIPWLRVLKKQVEDSNYTNCFDVVCAHGLLKHCADPAIVVKKAREALTPAGRLFVEDLSREDDVLIILKRLTAEIKDYLKPGKRKTSFYMKDDELIQLIENVGFQKQKYEKFVYTLKYASFGHIREFLTEKTIFGIYTYKAIPPKYRSQCDKTFSQIIKEEIEKPILHRRTFICLFKKT